MAETWLVTGANRGIGLELCRQLAARGATVIGTARRPAAAQELAALGVEVETLDVGQPESVQALAGRLTGRPIDALINNAGLGPDPGGISQLDPEAVLELVSVNAVGPLRLTQALLPQLRAGGRRLVASLSSELGSLARNTSGGYYGYRAAKAALNMLHLSLAHELAGRGFVCVVLNPGWVQTEMGGPAAPLPASDSVRGMLSLLDRLTPADNGGFFSWDGSQLPW